MNADGDPPVEFGLVMPFVNVRSVGGCYDDEAYAAGWEAGDLDALLKYQQPPVHEQSIREGNAEQVDLVAMHHGYQAATEATEVDGWLTLKLTKAVGP